MKVADVIGKTLSSRKSEVIHTSWIGNMHPACRRKRGSVTLYQETNAEVNCGNCLRLILKLADYLLLTPEEIGRLEEIQQRKKEFYGRNGWNWRPTIIDRITNVKKAMA